MQANTNSSLLAGLWCKTWSAGVGKREVGFGGTLDLRCFIIVCKKTSGSLNVKIYPRARARERRAFGKSPPAKIRGAS